MKVDTSTIPMFVPFEQRYEIRQQLWLDGPHGGWLALDRLLGRQVVVNIPYRPDDDQRFLHMARFRARLRHVHLIPLYDLGATKDGKPFFTEPYVEARKLWRLLEGKVADVTLVRLVSSLLDVCKAVAFLHATGFLHLELHPGNVLVTPQFQEVFVVRGHPSLPAARTNREGADVGLQGVSYVPAYMAPETADPKRLGELDVLTDVYGLGGILFEILYGNPPNGRWSAVIGELVTAVMARKGPPEGGTFCARAARWPDLARKLEPVCLRALESDRPKRQASVTAFVRKIEESVWGWG